MAKGTVVQKIIDAHYVAGVKIPGQPVAIKIVMSAWGLPRRMAASIGGIMIRLGTGRVWSLAMMTIFSFPSANSQVSGLWQYWHRIGHPWKNTTNRTPGPSTVPNVCIE